MIPRFSASVLPLALLGSVTLAPVQGAANPPGHDFFEAKIRPVLADRCYDCHSLEKGKAKGGLTLDTKAGWEKGSENGPVIVPGKPEESILIKAVQHDDPDQQMPPKGGPLTPAQIADLTAWVKQGAPDPRVASTESKLSGLNEKARSHWAYQPLKPVAIPAVKNEAWCANDIDRFVLAKLEEKGMAPAEAATRQTLIRRASYDLTGLPPTPQEVLAYVNDKAPDAWEKVVDHLLASPHYGERWGRHWLDTARYADTTGGDMKMREDYRYAHAWTYRDWVIKAFNDDKPYDRMIVEQLAADRLPEAEQGQNHEALAALGFLTVGQRFPMANDTINDRIDAVCKGFLGLTVSCARCHDHKFDPVPQDDYYSLHGIFASTVEPKTHPILAAAEGAQFQDYQNKKAALEKENRGAYYRAMARNLTDFCRHAGGYLMLAKDARGGGKKKGGDQKARLEAMRKYRLEADDVRRVSQSLDRSGMIQSPVFAAWRMFALIPDGKFPEAGKRVAAQISSGRSLRPIHPLVAKAFAGKEPQSLDEVAAIYTQLFTEAIPQIDPLFKAMAESKDGTVNGFDRDMISLLRTPIHVMTADQLDTPDIREVIGRWQPRDVARAGFVFGQLNELELKHPGAPARAMAVADSDAPRNSPVLLRGQVETKGAIVPRRFVEILSGGERPIYTQGSGRLELAKAIASPQNPMTARVAVNRAWMHHFGEGFVPTADDLGVQSEKPSHPELIDWLAGKFIADGWSLKKLHRQILLSSAWRQSSDTKAEYEKLDPQNRLLWRANIRRLDFEGVRDSLLVYSQQLDDKMFGQPVNITDEPYSHRRSVYGYIDRGNLPDLLQNFDFSDPDMPNSTRASTVVPQQALFLMNSALAVDCARKLVDRPEFTAAHDDLGKIRALYEIVFQRWPKPSEIQMAQAFLMQKTDSGDRPVAKAGGPARMTLAEFRALPKEKRIEARKNGTAPDLPGGKVVAEAVKKAGRNAGRAPIQNEGEKVQRGALDAWESYAQALLLTNELAYVN